MIAIDKHICFKCVHLHAFGRGCDAFPRGIPYQIAEEGAPHNKPLKGQKNKIVFKKGIPADAVGTPKEAFYKKFQ